MKPSRRLPGGLRIPNRLANRWVTIRLQDVCKGGCADGHGVYGEVILAVPRGMA
jgi:hypothetical protein